MQQTWKFVASGVANVCLVFPALDVSFVNTYYNMYIVNNA